MEKEFDSMTNKENDETMIKNANIDESEKMEDVNQNDESDDTKKVQNSKNKNKKVKKVDIKEELGYKLAEISDKYMRLSADFDNYRKRNLKEKIELTKTANENLLVNILPVMDDFDRALQLIDNAKDIDAVKQGIQLIHNKFSEFIAQNGIKEIDAKDKDFDTDLHEAVTKYPVDSEENKGKVIDIVQKGYTLNDKVIRFAKVVVGE
ncbi:MAG: nucleotide exchange factor GrpE [Bacteroidota bacterium]